MNAIPLLPNALARRLFLHRHGLGDAPSGPAKGAALCEVIDRIGFVQVDSINTVERAHHMILWSRRPTYRPPALKRLAEKDRALFEHWTHDASILPIAVFPHWKHRFARADDRLRHHWHRWFSDGYEAQLDTILNRVAAEGPVSSSEVGEGEERRGGWWEWHPSKTALEWLWRIGKLSVTRREGFRKYYDLTERVIPDPHRLPDIPGEEHVDWACSTALDRLGFATTGELQAYWNAITPEEARAWAKGALAAGRLIEVDIEGADGKPRRSLARPDLLDQAAALPPAPNRLRILSPFDPALRDRARAERLFGFFYRIEVFVPEPKRQYGYYVFPVMEGERLIGRIDVKAFRDQSTLRIRAYWPEARQTMPKARLARLEGELSRLADFAGCERVEFAEGWLRDGT